MKPLLEFSAPLLDNSDKFQDAFFKRFTLRPHPVQLTDTITKDYVFPTLYHDVRCAIGIFLCDYEAARAELPHPKLRPVRMPRGRALVLFSCYEYRHVLNVPPYNEIAMTIPVMFNATLPIPVLPMLLPIFPSFGYYVFHMPVTSRENTLRGNKIWGLPKVTHEVDIDERDGNCVTVAKDETGANYFELAVPMGGTPSHFDVTGKTYSQLDGQIVQAQTKFAGDFMVAKFTSRLWKKGGEPMQSYLKIGGGPYGERLAKLGIEPQPFQLRYTQGMNAAFDLPR